MTGEWRHRTITGTVLAAPDRVRLLAAKTLPTRRPASSCRSLVTVATMVVGTLILSSRGEETLGPGGLADVLWRNLAVAALLGPLGVCVGALVRNQIVTVIGLIVVAAVARAGALPTPLPAVGRFGPLFGAPGGILGGSTRSGCSRPASRSRRSSPGSASSSWPPARACAAATSSDAKAARSHLEPRRDRADDVATAPLWRGSASASCCSSRCAARHSPRSPDGTPA